MEIHALSLSYYYYYYYYNILSLSILLFCSLLLTPYSLRRSNRSRHPRPELKRLFCSLLPATFSSSPCCLFAGTVVDCPLDGWAACSHVTSFGDAARLRGVELFAQLGS